MEEINTYYNQKGIHCHLLISLGTRNVTSHTTPSHIVYRIKSHDWEKSIFLLLWLTPLSTVFWILFKPDTVYLMLARTQFSINSSRWKYEPYAYVSNSSTTHLIISEQTDYFVFSSPRGSSESLYSFLKHQQLSVQRPHKVPNLIVVNFSTGLTLIRGSNKTVILLCLDYVKVFLSLLTQQQLHVN